MNMPEGEVEGQMARMKAIYNSMSKKERKNPDIIDGNRRRRIATGGSPVSRASRSRFPARCCPRCARAACGCGSDG
jgi:signal recognition particle GTPase